MADPYDNPFGLPDGTVAVIDRGAEYLGMAAINEHLASISFAEQCRCELAFTDGTTANLGRFLPDTEGGN